MKAFFLLLTRLLFSGLANLFGWIKGQPASFYFSHVNDAPDRPQKKIVYLVGEKDQRWFAVFLCPCGCGETIQLSLLSTTQPRWGLTEHEDGTVSISPSIWRTKGCKSHFFLKKGAVVWAQ